ncbi:PiggyBac transposable element-derived protein 4, partial [Anthophora retusa]
MRLWFPREEGSYSGKGYTWSTKIYAGRDSCGVRQVGIAEKVCIELIDKLLNEGRTLFIDNFYTSYELAVKLLDFKTHVVGMVRHNKKFMPKAVMLHKLKRGEIISREDNNGIVVLKWRDARDVRVLSSKHAPLMTRPLFTDVLQKFGNSWNPKTQGPKQ